MSKPTGNPRGPKFKEFRKSLRATQDDLAEEAGVDRSVIARVEATDIHDYPKHPTNRKCVLQYYRGLFRFAKATRQRIPVSKRQILNMLDPIEARWRGRASGRTVLYLSYRGDSSAQSEFKLSAQAVASALGMLFKYAGCAGDVKKFVEQVDKAREKGWNLLVDLPPDLVEEDDDRQSMYDALERASKASLANVDYPARRTSVVVAGGPSPIPGILSIREDCDCLAQQIKDVIENTYRQQPVTVVAIHSKDTEAVIARFRSLKNCFTPDEATRNRRTFVPLELLTRDIPSAAAMLRTIIATQRKLNPGATIVLVSLFYSASEVLIQGMLPFKKDVALITTDYSESWLRFMGSEAGKGWLRTFAADGRFVGAIGMALLEWTCLVKERVVDSRIESPVRYKLLELYPEEAPPSGSLDDVRSSFFRKFYDALFQQVPQISYVEELLTGEELTN